MQGLSQCLSPPVLVSSTDTEKASEEDKAVLKEQIDKLLSLDLNKRFVNKLSKSMKTYLKSAHTSSVDEKILRINAIFNMKRGRKIGVQPTSINRRRKGTTKKNTATPAGQPSKSGIQKDKRQSFL